jgi:uroporphyrinogen decarboxylase
MATGQMTRRERVHATLRGQEADRTPVSMWRHFYDREADPVFLAEAMLGFQSRFDWDFMKVNPRASYHVEGWGLKTAYHGSEHPRVTDYPIKAPADWLKIEVQPLHRGVLDEQLRCLESIARGLKGEVPFIMTVFTPLAIAGRMTPSEDVFVRHLREHPDELEYALGVITETFARFGRACLERGASGLYFATTAFATSDRLTPQEYERWGRPYDLQLLNALPQADFHVLHVCRDNAFLTSLADYPVHAISWDCRGQGNPSLAAGKDLIGGKTAVGGIRYQGDLVAADPVQLTAEVEALRAAMGRRGWMLGSGCTFPPETPEVNVAAVRRAAD